MFIIVKVITQVLELVLVIVVTGVGNSSSCNRSSIYYKKTCSSSCSKSRNSVTVVQEVIVAVGVYQYLHSSSGGDETRISFLFMKDKREHMSIKNEFIASAFSVANQTTKVKNIRSAPTIFTQLLTITKCRFIKCFMMKYVRLLLNVAGDNS